MIRWMSRVPHGKWYEASKQGGRDMHGVKFNTIYNIVLKFQQ